MKELYGILGGADSPAEVIQGSLSDIQTKVKYLVPWYGVKPIPPSLIAVYDWMIDNEADYDVLVSSDGASCPKALREGATSVVETDNPSMDIIKLLADASPAGFALIMWDEVNPVDSMSLAITCIKKAIPALELTAGLSPIIMDDDELEIEIENETVDISDLPTIDPTEWDRETLDIMPASSVKRLARDAGHDVKTKAEAIQALKGGVKEVLTDEEIGSILILLNDGTELGFSMNKKLLKEIMDLVVKSQT